MSTDVEAPAPEASVDDLLQEVETISADIRRQQADTSKLIDRRLELYHALRGRNVPFARIDEASGNEPGAARAAIYKQRRRAAGNPVTRNPRP